VWEWQALANCGPASIHRSHGVSSLESRLENGMRKTKISEVSLTLQLSSYAIEPCFSAAEYRRCGGSWVDAREFLAASIGPQRFFSAFVPRDPAGQIDRDIPFSAS
jgi:hypothetical protein